MKILSGVKLLLVFNWYWHLNAEAKDLLMLAIWIGLMSLLLQRRMTHGDKCTEKKRVWEWIQPRACGVSGWGEVSSCKRCQSCCLQEWTADLPVCFPRWLPTLFLFIIWSSVFCRGLLHFLLVVDSTSLWLWHLPCHCVKEKSIWVWDVVYKSDFFTLNGFFRFTFEIHSSAGIGN